MDISNHKNKLLESENIIESNKQVISYLNQQLNENAPYRNFANVGKSNANNIPIPNSMNTNFGSFKTTNNNLNYNVSNSTQSINPSQSHNVNTMQSQNDVLNNKYSSNPNKMTTEITKNPNVIMSKVNY